MKRVYVKDSYHTDKIAQSIEGRYGKENIEVSTKLSGRFDLFFVSGKEVLYGEISPKQLKTVYGNPGAKVLALSAMQEFLTRIADRPELGVDVALSKTILVSGLDLACSSHNEQDLDTLDGLMSVHRPD